MVIGLHTGKAITIIYGNEKKGIYPIGNIFKIKIFPSCWVYTETLFILNILHTLITESKISDALAS